MSVESCDAWPYGRIARFSWRTVVIGAEMAFQRRDRKKQTEETKGDEGGDEAGINRDSTMEHAELHVISMRMFAMACPLSGCRRLTLATGAGGAKPLSS
jgi:hypothetical protein